MEINKIYCESNLETMARMPNNFIDLTVTSPPYDNLREYKGFSFPFEDIARELYRVTKEGGVVVWVVGDSVINGSESCSSFKQALFFVDCGFNLHDTMIYKKYSSSFPEKTRYYQVFEYMFIFSKGKPKSINLISDKKNKWAGSTSFGKSSFRQKDGTLIQKEKIKCKDFSIRENVWEIANGYGFSTKDDIAFNHPAIFPEELVQDHIRTWSNENDLIYDCFGGSGTTAKMAHLQKRNWIISEISKEYTEIAEKRIAPYLQQQRLF